jgi:hypothetical protein
MAAGLRNKIKFFSPKAYLREILAVLMLLLAVIFFATKEKSYSILFPVSAMQSRFGLLQAVA